MLACCRCSHEATDSVDWLTPSPLLSQAQKQSASASSCQAGCQDEDKHTTDGWCAEFRCAGVLQVAPTSMRGTLGSLNQLMICLGILAALVVNVALPVTSWRTMFMLAAVPAALLFLGELCLKV